MRKSFIIFFLLLLCRVHSYGCTNFLVGKAASTDGSTIVSYAGDNFIRYGELFRYPAALHPVGAMRNIFDYGSNKLLGQIPEASQTYSVIGHTNEFQVTIGETTFGGRPELTDTLGTIDYGSLIFIALQRSRTAREAIKVMTTLVAQYGYCSGGESFSIADPNEIWIMEMVGKGVGNKGALWVAVRIPDDCIAAHSNHSRIQQFNLKDKKNCLYSPDVISFARSKGYFSGKDKDFSFAAAFDPIDFGGRRYSEARTWAFFNMFTSEGNTYLPYILGKSDIPMPLYMKPTRKLSVEDIKNAMRDHYENTPLDISKDYGAGPYHAPYRLSPLSFKYEGREYFNERPISTYQSAFVYVSQMRSNLPNAIGGVFWFAVDDANCAVFTPVYCCTDTVPRCLSHIADAVTFNWDSSFWVFNWVSNMVYQRYDLMIGDLRRLQTEIESNFSHNQDSIEAVAKELYATNPAAAKKMLTNYSIACAQSTHDAWRKLGEFFIVKYNDGVVRQEKDGKFLKTQYGNAVSVKRPGYSQEFIKEYIRQTGDRYLIPKQEGEKK